MTPSSGREHRVLTTGWVTWVVCLVVIGGCVSIRTTGAGSVEDLVAEDRYKAVYANQIARVHAALQLFAPSANNPGVCNAGGNKQGCIDADVALMHEFQVLFDSLTRAPVPPRFAEADKLLREAIAENIRGLELRNTALATGDEAAWDEHSVVLKEAAAMILQAHEAFPQDNRPQPPP